MKFKFGSFLSGFLAAALLGGLTISALAITGKTTIEVYPINVMVNGEVFQPTDAQGTPVDVFTYKGTTYAPLRALAEAYGLEVGYDAEAKLATVTDPKATPATPDTTAKPDYSDWSAEDEAAYQEFKGMWEIRYDETYSDIGHVEYYDLTCIEDFTSDEICDAINNAQKNGFLKRLSFELQSSDRSVYFQFLGHDRTGYGHYRSNADDIF